MEKYQNFYLKIFKFWVVKFLIYLNRGVSVTWCKITVDCDGGQFKSSKVHRNEVFCHVAVPFVQQRLEFTV